MTLENFEIRTDHVNLTDEQFFNLCQDNDFLRFERTADGQILVMTPSGIYSSNRNIEIAYFLSNWNKEYDLGYVFGSDAGFTLPNNAVRAPYCSFIYKDKFEALSNDEKEKFADIVPDFVIELMSPSDSLKHHQDKMKEYMDNGVLLGWLINPKTEEVFVYRLNGDIEQVNGFGNKLSGENVLPGFTFELSVLK
jgi:Uma2 family endonuclease